MEQTIIIVIAAVVVLFVLLYKKKQKEQQIGNKLESLVKANDWKGVSRLLLKQLLLWGGLLFLVLFALGLGLFLEEKIHYSLIAVLIVIAWRFIKLVRIYSISRHNAKALQAFEDCHGSDEELIAKAEALLKHLNTSRISAEATPQAIMQIWLDAYSRGKREGFHPVLLEIDWYLVESLEEVFADSESFNQWQDPILNNSAVNGKDLLNQIFEDLKESYENDGEWEANVVGTDLQFEAFYEFTFNSDSILLVEVPVKHPWQVFAHIPFGGWNGCPDEVEHMAVAKYWCEMHGAVVAHLTSNGLEYYVPKPVLTNTMQLAQEQLGYCEDLLQDGINLTTLARMNQASIVWSFWWD